jgi:Tfp pilus assembly protein PilF
MEAACLLRFSMRTIVLSLLLVSFVAGCARKARTPAEGYKTVEAAPLRSPDLARQENARAIELLDRGDYAEAEKALRAALDADVMCGPAHNALGKVYFHQGKLYEAAWEFQYAMKLMPNQPEPHNNLGLVFEAVGKLDEATDAYGKAVAMEPDNVHAMGNLARARVRRGDRDEELQALLNNLILRDTRADWLAWERKTLARLQARTPE